MEEEELKLEELLASKEEGGEDLPESVSDEDIERMFLAGMKANREIDNTENLRGAGEQVIDDEHIG